jgi:hypothetical protein
MIFAPVSHTPFTHFVPSEVQAEGLQFDVQLAFAFTQF